MHSAWDPSRTQGKEEKVVCSEIGFVFHDTSVILSGKRINYPASRCTLHSIVSSKTINRQHGKGKVLSWRGTSESSSALWFSVLEAEKEVLPASILCRVLSLLWRGCRVAADLCPNSKTFGEPVTCLMHLLEIKLNLNRVCQKINAHQKWFLLRDKFPCVFDPKRDIFWCNVGGWTQPSTGLSYWMATVLDRFLSLWETWAAFVSLLFLANHEPF